MDIKKLMAEGALDNISDDLFKSVSSYSEEVKAFQRQKAAEYADQVVAALKKIEQDIKERYDRVGLNLEKRVLNIKDGKDGINGRDGRDGKDGKTGPQGLPGRDGKDGKNGRDGVDGKDGVSVVNAFFDFDNSLVIELSDGKQINAGAILGSDFAEKVKIIANGGGTSQGVLDTLASLQAQISAISSLGAVSYQGTWNASTNSPTITGGSGTKGYYYVVNVAGSTSIDGEAKWGVGDWIVYNGSAWQKVDGGSTGNLTTLDVSSSATLSYGTANGIAYLNGSKVITTGSALTFDGTSMATTSLGYDINNANALVRFYNGSGTRRGYVQVRSDAFEIWSDQSAVPMIFGQNNTEQMRLTSTGLLIKTSSAINGWSYPLQVNGFVGIQASANNNLEIFTPNSGTGIRLFARNNAGTLNRLELQGGQVIFPLTTGADGLYFDASSGNLGLGTSSPTQKLEVAGNVNITGAGTSFGNGLNLIQSSVSANRWGFVPSGGALYLGKTTDSWGTNSVVATFDASGNLGIGTSSPAEKLDVNGNVIIPANKFYKLGSGNYLYSDGSNTVELAAGTSGKLNFVTNGASRAVLDSSGNLGIGVTPSAWSAYKVFQIAGSNALYGNNSDELGATQNAYYNAGWKYGVTGVPASWNYQYQGKTVWNTAPSGTAGAAISFTQAMTLDASGNLLVGATSALLSAANRGNITLNGSSNAILAFGNAGSYSGYIYSSSTNLEIDAQGSRFIQLNTNGSERMRLDSSGNLGIGTTSPTQRLHLSIGSATAIYNRISNTAGDCYLGLDTSGNTNLSADNVGNQLIFRTVAAERMRIDSSGNLLVGYTASNGSYLLQVNSQIYATNATIATSDGRYKESVQPLQNALSLISTLNPVSFKWKHHDVHNFAVGETDVGFIAQEVKQSLEDTAYVNQVVKSNTCTLTDGTKEEFLGIAEGKMIPLLVKAIQELKAEVDSLKAQLNK